MPVQQTARAVILGGGLSGMLAAAALAPHSDTVTVVERDRFPDGPVPRRGLPQARHAHMLMAGGAHAIDLLLPGTIDRLLAAGAHRIGMPEDIVSMSAYGWQQRFPATGFVITCSRDLIDWTVRRAALRDPRISVLEDAEVVGLTGDAARVTGARIRARETGAERNLPADLVVNATGRGSPMRRWFAALGAVGVDEDVVDTGVAYATRVFRAPERARERFPLVAVYADHRVPRPGRSAVLAPIEDGRWIVTVAGTRGAEPGTDPDAFVEFAREVRDPVVARLIGTAEPLTPVHGSRSSVNRRVRLDRMARWPDGFVVLGDALAAFNPVHGHGMSAAARAAAALAEAAARTGIRPGLAAAVQPAIGATVDDPWLLATMLDVCYPGCRVDATDPRLTGPDRTGTSGRSFAETLGTAALSDPAVSAAVIAVNTLSAPLASLRSPDLLAAAPDRAPLRRPPLRSDEVARLEVARLSSR